MDTATCYRKEITTDLTGGQAFPASVPTRPNPDFSRGDAETRRRNPETHPRRVRHPRTHMPTHSGIAGCRLRRTSVFVPRLRNYAVTRRRATGKARGTGGRLITCVRGGMFRPGVWEERESSIQYPTRNPQSPRSEQLSLPTPLSVF